MIHGLTKCTRGNRLCGIFRKTRAAVYAESKRFQVDTPLHASRPSIFYPVELIAGGAREQRSTGSAIAGIIKKKKNMIRMCCADLIIIYERKSWPTCWRRMESPSREITRYLATSEIYKIKICKENSLITRLAFRV